MRRFFGTVLVAVALAVVLAIGAAPARAQTVGYDKLPTGCNTGWTYDPVGGLITCLPEREHNWCFSWSSNDTPTTGTFPVNISLPTSAIIDSLSGYTGGTGTPILTANITANGSPLTGCSAVPVPAAGVVSACSGGTIGSATQVAVGISALSGTPAGPAMLCVNWRVVTP